jgi:deazaflavin-dependent oxidoreductase (nitroreductase family)
MSNMNTQRNSLITNLSKKLGSSRPGAWLFARILHYLDHFVLKTSQGKHSLTGGLTGLPIVTVTTIGAKSGLKRTLPLVYIQDPADSNRFALIASNFGQAHNPAWYYNLKAKPRAVCTLEGKTGEYQAHEATGAEYEKFWQKACGIYEGYTQYKQRVGDRHIPILVMTPLI